MKVHEALSNHSSLLAVKATRIILIIILEATVIAKTLLRHWNTLNSEACRRLIAETAWVVSSWGIVLGIVGLLAVLVMTASSMMKSKPSIRSVNSSALYDQGPVTLGQSGVSRGDYSSIRSSLKGSSVFNDRRPKRISETCMNCCPFARDVERGSLSTIASLDIADDEYEIVVEKLCVFKVPLSITALPEDLDDRPVRFGFLPTAQETFLYKQDIGGYEDYWGKDSSSVHPTGQNKHTSSLYPSYFAMVPKRQDSNRADQASVSPSYPKNVPVQEASVRTYQRVQEIPTSATECKYQQAPLYQPKVRIDPVPSVHPERNNEPPQYYGNMSQTESSRPKSKRSQKEMISRYTAQPGRRDEVSNIPLNLASRTSASYFALVPSLPSNLNLGYSSNLQTIEYDNMISESIIPDGDNYDFKYAATSNYVDNVQPTEYTMLEHLQMTKQDDYARGGSDRPSYVTLLGSEKRPDDVVNVTSERTESFVDRHTSSPRRDERMDAPLSSSCNRYDVVAGTAGSDFQNLDEYTEHSYDIYGSPGENIPTSGYDLPAGISWQDNVKYSQPRRHLAHLPGPKCSAEDMPKLFRNRSGQKKSQDELSYYDVVPNRSTPQKKLSKGSIRKRVLQQQQQGKTQSRSQQRFATYYVSTAGPSFKKLTSNSHKKSKTQLTTTSTQENGSNIDPAFQSSDKIGGQMTMQLPVHSTLSWLPSLSNEVYQFGEKISVSGSSLNQVSSNCEPGQQSDQKEETSYKFNSCSSTAIHPILRETTVNTASNLDEKPLEGLPRMSFTHHLQDFEMSCLNMDQPNARGEEKVTTFWDQFSSVLIEHNVNDPIPKDPNTFPGGYRLMNTGRSNLADHISQFGSCQYSTKKHSLDNSPKRPRSADSDEQGKVYIPNPKRRPSSQQAQSGPDHGHAKLFDKSGDQEIQITNHYNNQDDHCFRTTWDARRNKPVDIRESVFSNEMGCAKLGNNIEFKIQQESVEYITPRKNASSYGMRVEPFDESCGGVPHYLSDESTEQQTPPNAEQSFLSNPKEHDFMYYTNLTQDSSMFGMLPLESNSSNRAGIDVKTEPSLAFITQPSSDFVMSPVSSNVMDDQSTGITSSSRQFGTQIEMVPSGCSDEITCIHLSSSEGYTYSQFSPSTVQMESIISQGSNVILDTVDASPTGFSTQSLPSPQITMTAMIQSNAPSVFNPSVYRPASAGYSRETTLNSPINKNKLVGKQSIKTHEPCNEHASSPPCEWNNRQDGFHQSALSFKKESNSNYEVDDQAELPASSSPSDEPSRDCAAWQDAVSPRNSRKRENTISELYSGDRASNDAVDNVVNNWGQQESSDSYDNINLSPREHTIEYISTSPSYATRQQSPENQVCHISATGNKIESPQLSHSGTECRGDNEGEETSHDRRKVSFCVSVNQSGSQESFDEDGALDLSKEVSSDIPGGLDAEQPEHANDENKSTELAQGTLLWTIMIKHRKHNTDLEQSTIDADVSPSPLLLQDSSTEED